MTRKSINIPGPWVAVAQAYDDAAARNPALSSHVRILSAARSRLEFNGHAHFARQELRTILSSVDRQTGELTPLSKSALTRAVQHLTDGGLLADGSWSQCLRLPLFGVQNGTGRTKGRPTCPRAPAGTL